MPMPPNSGAPVPILPWKRAANCEPWPPSLIAKVPPSSPATGSIVVPFLSRNVYQYPPRLSFGMFWLLPSSPSSIRPSAEHSLKPELPIGAPATAGAEGAEGAEGAAGAASVAAGAAAPPPIDAADPGAGPAPDPGGGAMQAPIASNPMDSVPTRSFISIFIFVVLVLEPDDGGDLSRVLVDRREPVHRSGREHAAARL